MERFSDLFKRKQTLEREVDEELRLHIDLQTRDYEGMGLSPDESRVQAESRFGNLEQIKAECLRISAGRRALILFLNSVFILNFLVGFLLRSLAQLATVNRVGDVMMMIGGLGILLVYCKQAGAFVSNSNSEPLRLGLKKPPDSFDEQGRSPFDRVRTDN